MSISLKVARDGIEWDALLKRCPQSTLFHTWDYLKITERHTKTRLYPMIGMRGTDPAGLYPVFIGKKALSNLAFSPPPGAGLLYLGPLILDYDDLKQNKKESTYTDLQREMDSFLFKDLKARYARIRSSPGIIDARPFKWNGYAVEPLYTYIADLGPGIDALWAGLNSQVRKDIRKTEKEGVHVKEGGRNELGLICESVQRRFREQGLRSNIPKEYLFDLFDRFHPANLKIFTVNKGDELIGGQITLYYKDKAMLWMGVPKTENKGIYPNDLLQWEMMKSAHAQGLRYYELMCAGDDIRLRHFKSKFNPEPSLWYSAERYPAPAYKAAESIFRTMQKIKNR
jgi:hypothetical protein